MTRVKNAITSQANFKNVKAEAKNIKTTSKRLSKNQRVRDKHADRQTDREKKLLATVEK